VHDLGLQQFTSENRNNYVALSGGALSVLPLSVCLSVRPVPSILSK